MCEIMVGVIYIKSLNNNFPTSLISTLSIRTWSLLTKWKIDKFELVNGN